MKRTPVAAALAAGLGLALLLGVAVAPASAKVKVKDGAYYQQVGTKLGVIGTEKGKITSATATVAFRKKGAGSCIPEGLSAYRGMATFSITLNHPARVNRKNRFSFKGPKQAAYPKLRTSVKGRFISSNKATFTVTAWQGACKGKVTLKKAKFTAGG